MAASAPNTPNSPDQRPTGDLEHLFRQKFAEAEVTPRASFWDQLDHELVVQQNEQVVQENVAFRRRLVLHRWVAAACLLLALGFGSWAFLSKNGPLAGPELAAQLPSDPAASPSPAAGSNPLNPAATAEADLPAAGLAAGSATSAAASTSESDNGAYALADAGPAAGPAGFGSMLRSLASAGSLGPASARPAGADFYPSAGPTGTTGSAGFTGQLASLNEASAAGFGAVELHTAQLRRLLHLARPDTLKPSLLSAPQLAAASAHPAPEPAPAPKLWRRLRLGGGYAVGSFNPNINFSRTDARVKSDPVTYALRNYYQEEAEAEYYRNLRAGLSQRVALTASYALNDRWTVLAGAEVAEQRATSATTYGFIDGRQVGAQAADLFNRPAAYMSAPAQPRTTSYRYRTASVPVSVRMGSSKPGLSMYAKVGAAVSLLLGTRSELEGSPEATRNYTLTSADSPYRQVLTSVRAGTGVRYQPANAAWSLHVGPTAEAGLTTLNAHPSQRVKNQSRPYSIGLEASVEFGSAKATPTVAQ